MTKKLLREGAEAIPDFLDWLMTSEEVYAPEIWESRVIHMMIGCDDYRAKMSSTLCGMDLSQCRISSMNMLRDIIVRCCDGVIPSVEMLMRMGMYEYALNRLMDYTIQVSELPSERARDCFMQLITQANLKYYIYSRHDIQALKNMADIFRVRSAIMWRALAAYLRPSDVLNHFDDLRFANQKWDNESTTSFEECVDRALEHSADTGVFNSLLKRRMSLSSV